MPKGKLGLPRPFAQYRIVIDPHQRDVNVLKVGPFGGPRPLAEDNPPVEDEEVAECMMSSAGRKFGAGVITRGDTTDISELSPEGQQKALELAEKWCRGSMEAQAIEDLEEGKAVPVLSRIRSTLSNMSGSSDQITIEMVSEDVGEASRVVEELA